MKVVVLAACRFVSPNVQGPDARLACEERGMVGRAVGDGKRD